VIRPFRLALALTAALPAPTHAQAEPASRAGPTPPRSRVDHIILWTGSLDRGIAEFARLTGVTPVVGGEHPGRGTRNALVSLGGETYLELLAPTVDSGPGVPLSPRGWAIGTDDLAGLRAGLKDGGITVSEPLPGSRRKPDGEMLTWQSAGVGMPSVSVPFFIEWGKEVRHPSATSPPGCTLESFAITRPDPGMVRALIDGLRLPVIVHTGAESASITLRCPKGLVTF